MIRSAGAGVELDVRVIPRAKKTEIGGTRRRGEGAPGTEDETLVVRLNAPPVDGAANDALIALLARTLDVPRSAIRIVSGERGRRKRVVIAGVTPERIRALL